MNRVELIGRLTKGIELRSTASGKSVTEFTLAVNRKTKEKQTDFIPCVAWNKTAELLAQYTSKGDLIGVEGSVQTRNYIDPNTNKKVYVTEILVDGIDFTKSKGTESSTMTLEKVFSTPDDEVEVLQLDSDDLPF